jgi:hypothetical protein
MIDPATTILFAGSSGDSREGLAADMIAAGYDEAEVYEAVDAYAAAVEEETGEPLWPSREYLIRQTEREDAELMAEYRMATA